MFQNFQIFLACSVILLVFAAMQLRRNAPTEVLFCLALVVFVLFGLISPDQAWVGFADPSVVAIAGLLVVSAALRSSGVLDAVGRSLLGNVSTEQGALGRLSLVVVTCSAFLLNTAIVAMLLPLAIAWCRRKNVAPSRLLLPISYLAILGGTCTLVGTSTNLLVQGLLRDVSQDVEGLQRAEAKGVPEEQLPPRVAELKANYRLAWLTAGPRAGQLQPMGLTEISWIGVPCAMAGVLVLILFGRRLLPNRTELLDSLEDRRREYLVEMLVTQGCTLIGKTVEEGGLRHLPGLFLIEIDRDGEILGPVSPSDRIYENDRLVFTGVVATIVDLEKIPGLVPAADINYEISPAKAASRVLVEVVLSPSSPLVGSTIRQADFRQRYGAAVVAVHRNGERLPTKIGDIELSAGDTLLLQTQPGFVRSFRNRPDFYLVSSVEDSNGRRHDKLVLASATTLGMIVWLFMMPLLKAWSFPEAFWSPAVAIVATALTLIATRCLSIAEARRSIDVPMLLTVGAAIGVGKAIAASGAASAVAELVISGTGSHPYLCLIAVFVLTVCFTEMISNVAVAAMMFFIALELACQLDVNPRPFIMAITLGASLSFISPIGYQTNLMVMGPGGYQPRDYLRAGLPMGIVVGVIALLLIPLVWPF
ncbi:MAG: SLC13 family permease [Planctomycetales bacterium]|nr:SLC13 family permease [Planctomycetales bacterium]